jgi:hypothetical protein
VLIGDRLLYRVKAAPEEIAARLRDWQGDVDKIRMRGNAFWLGPHGLSSWFSWRRGIWLHGRIMGRGAVTEVEVWYPFDLIWRVVSLVGVLVAVLTFPLTLAAAVMLVAALNFILLGRAQQSLRSTLEVLLETPSRPAWRYSLDGP